MVSFAFFHSRVPHKREYKVFGEIPVPFDLVSAELKQFSHLSVLHFGRSLRRPSSECIKKTAIILSLNPRRSERRRCEVQIDGKGVRHRRDRL